MSMEYLQSLQAAHKERLTRISSRAVPDEGIDLRRHLKAPKPAPAHEPLLTRPMPVEEYKTFKIIRAYPMIAAIQRAVRAHYKIKLMDFISNRRLQGIVRPRQIAMYLCKTLTPHSYPEIARRFRRDHSTVIHGIGVITRFLGDSNPKYNGLRADISYLTGLLTPPIIKEITHEHG